VRRLSVERIRDLGYRTLEAETADSAYAIVKTTPDISLVFSDLVMPGEMTGYDLAHRLRTEFPKMKILLTSGYSEDIFRNDANKLETFSLLTKPFRQAELANRLQALFARE